MKAKMVLLLVGFGMLFLAAGDLGATPDGSVKPADCSRIRSKSARTRCESRISGVRKPSQAEIEARREAERSSRDGGELKILETRIPVVRGAANMGNVSSLVRLTFTKRDEAVCLLVVDVLADGNSVPRQSFRQEDNCAVLGREREFLRFDDFNFDEVPDLMIWDATASGATNLAYEVYLSDRKTGRFAVDPNFPQGYFPTVIDANRNLIGFHYNGGHAGAIGGTSMYRYREGRFIPVSTEARSWLPDVEFQKLGCGASVAKSGEPGCRLVEECRRQASVGAENPSPNPACAQYVQTVTTYDDAGVKARTEEHFVVPGEEGGWRRVR